MVATLNVAEYAAVAYVLCAFCVRAFVRRVQVFHDVAYKARDRYDLLAGIDEFLDCVTVLPPGEWDPTIRIEPPKSVPSQVSPCS